MENSDQRILAAVDNAFARGLMQLAGDPPGPREEKYRLHEVVKRVVQLVIRDRARVLTELVEEAVRVRDAARETGENCYLPIPAEVLASRMWDGWTEEERAEVLVEDGYCIVDTKQWFRVKGDPERVEEPQWSYIIDPLPMGVSVYDQSNLAAPNILVVEPMSMFSRIYAAIRGVVRPSKA